MIGILMSFAFLIVGVTASCPSESYEWQSNCYFFQTNSSEFADAESACYSLGGHLASIHDGFTNTLLTQKGSHFFQNITITNFWIGLTNMITLEAFTWMDGTSTDFFEWESGEPDNYTGANCAALSLRDGRWKTDNCLQSKPFVCKVDKRVFDITTTPSQKCHGNFSYFELTNSCYGLFYPYWEGKTWSFGEELCQNNYNGHLASIHSYEEMQFVLHVATPNDFANTFPWTGLYSPDQNESWKWSDGTPFDFVRWAPANPIDDDSRNCVYLRNGGYNNYLCDQTSSIVCKIQLNK